MLELSEKTKKRLLLFPLIPISLALLYSIIIEIFFKSFADAPPFVDLYIFRNSFVNYPNLYNYDWYIYTPAFIIEFFWINILPFNIVLVIWIIIKITFIMILWRIILYSKKINFMEFLTFIILVLILGAVNDIYTENSDTVLLACGMLGYFSLNKAEKIQNDDTYSNKYLSNNQAIILLNMFAGFIIAFGMFKPIFFVILPIIFLKSNRKYIFISTFIIWLIVSNFLFFLNLKLLILYIERAGSGQTLVGSGLLFKSDILNIIFRNGFTPFRIQVWFYPILMLYVFRFIKNEKIRKYWALFYAIAFGVFFLLSIVLLLLGL